MLHRKNGRQSIATAATVNAEDSAEQPLRSQMHRPYTMVQAPAQERKELAS